MLEENDEILWCERLDSEEELNDENEANDDHEVAEMEQMVQRAARKGNERGANVYEKSLIWAADIEWKKLNEKGAVRILSGDSADKAKTQFGDRFTPSHYVVTRPNPGEFKARWCLRGYLDPDVNGTVWWWFHPVSNCVSVGTHAAVSNDCEQRLELAVVPERPSRRNSRGAG